MEIAKSKKYDLIVVLGMHRSGTSLITRGLQVLGIELGNKLLQPLGDNSKGFFEDLDVLDLNIRLLNHLGLDWHYAAPVTDYQVKDLCESGYLLKAASLAREKTTSKRPFGIKDPRLSKLMPFWKEVFQHCQLNVGYVIVVRNPISVAKSLQGRNGFSFEKSYMLWLDHTLAALLFTQGEKRVVIDFDMIIESPVKEIGRLAEAFELSVDADAVSEYASEFLDENLRGSIDQLQDLAIDPRISPLIGELYFMLSEAAKAGCSILMNKEQLAYFEKGRNNLRSSMVYIDRLQQAAADRDGQLATLNQAVVERDGQLTALNYAVEERDRQLATLSVSVHSAIKWQKRSIIKRIFHKWRPPNAAWKKVPCFKKLERSIRKRLGGILTPITRPFLFPPFRPAPRRSAPPLALCQPGLVSVIIPIHDRTHELSEAIESVRRQSYTNWELILVTDGSPPATMKVVDFYRDDPRIRIYPYLDKSGTAVRGRNRGIKEARGEYVAFLDSDDIAAPDRLAISVREMERGGHDVVYGAWTAKIDGSRRFDDLRDGQFVTSPPCDLQLLERSCVPCQSTVMVRRHALLDVGGLKPEMRYREDHELWMRLAYFGYRFGVIYENLVHLRLHAGNNELNFKRDDGHWERQAKATYRRKSRLLPTIAYLIPGTGISGGIAVILEHVNRLRRAGYDVFMISQDNKDSISWWPCNEVPIIPFDTPHRYLLEGIDTLVATGWPTVQMLDHLTAGRKLYFVQSDERRFDDSPEFKRKVQETYLRRDVEFVTMAGWICRWLNHEFGHNCEYVPNGIDAHRFQNVQPLEPKGQKLRILLEGPIAIPFKGMAEAAAAVADCADCEIWIVSSAGRPQPGWRCDRSFEAVPHGEMAAIYASCDILLKMSQVESFGYPPLEMMATGGSVVVHEVTGLDEYAVHEENCLIVSDVASARKAIRRLIDDPALRARLGAAGRRTADGMSWDRSMPSLLRSVGGAAPAAHPVSGSLSEADA